MHHRLSFSLGLGGMGAMGRLVIALGILIALRYLDKNNPEYDKAIKTLLIGGVALFILAVFIFAILRGTALFPFFMFR